MIAGKLSDPVRRLSESNSDGHREDQYREVANRKSAATSSGLPTIRQESVAASPDRGTGCAERK